jgi:hypothetical protein
VLLLLLRRVPRVFGVLRAARRADSPALRPPPTPKRPHPAQMEQALKYSRFLAGLKGQAARREVSELVSAVMEQLPLLHLLDDRLCAVVEAAQVRSAAPCLNCALWRVLGAEAGAPGRGGRLLAAPDGADGAPAAAGDGAAGLAPAAHAAAVARRGAGAAGGQV